MGAHGFPGNFRAPHREGHSASQTQLYPKSRQIGFLYLQAHPHGTFHPWVPPPLARQRSPRLETQKHLNTFLILLWLFRSPLVSPRFFLTLVPSKNCPASQKIISRRAVALKVCKLPWKELPFTGCCICRWHFTVILVRMKISDYFILRCMLFEYKCLPGVSALCYT